MATTKQQTGEETRASQGSQGHGQGASEMQRRDREQPRRLRQRQDSGGANIFAPIGLGPFALIRRMQEDIDRLLSSTAPGQMQRETESPTSGETMPALEAVQRGNEFVIRLDLPGVDADTVDVEISEDAVSVRGERRIEREDERDGVYISEVAYGSFERVIPLPPGAIVENATARLVNGVLEVVVPAPAPEAQRGRRLDVQRGAGERTESGQRR